MDFNEEDRAGNVKVSDYKYVYDKYYDKIYTVHTPKTDGETGTLHSVICPDCKSEMMKGEEYYCPICHV